MANKTMEDWFLRGGERPQGKLPDPPNEIPADNGEDFDDKEDIIACPHCGGENFASKEYCTHYELSLYDDDDDDDDESVDEFGDHVNAVEAEWS